MIAKQSEWSSFSIYFNFAKQNRRRAHQILEVRIEVSDRDSSNEVKSGQVPYDTTPGTAQVKLCINSCQEDMPLVGTMNDPEHLDYRAMRMEYRVSPMAHAMAIADHVCCQRNLRFVQCIDRGRKQINDTVSRYYEVFYFILANE